MKKEVEDAIVKLKLALAAVDAATTAAYNGGTPEIHDAIAMLDDGAAALEVAVDFADDGD